MNNAYLFYSICALSKMIMPYLLLNCLPILYSFYLDCNHKGQLLGVMGYQCLSHKRVTEMIIQAALSSVTNLANEL